MNISTTLMHKNIYNCILGDSEGPLLTFSQSCNRDKKENPHSHHLQLHHYCVCTSVLLFESCLGNTLCDTILCVIMQGILYFHTKDLVRGFARHVFSIAFELNSPLNDESNESWRQFSQ